MARNRTIIDAYTDEPAGLGVPPYVGVWPRYAAGQYRDGLTYLTIDDLRRAAWRGRLGPDVIDSPTGRTRIDLLNATRPVDEVRRILAATNQFIVIAGVQTPGKYLSARPGTLAELRDLLAPYKAYKILTGPAVLGGTQVRGGARPEEPQAIGGRRGRGGLVDSAAGFDEVRSLTYDDYDQLQPWAMHGLEILGQVPGLERRILEIETGRGCPRDPGCSFCTEPLKHPLQWRLPDSVHAEVRRAMELGVRAFRLGKQSCIFSYRGGDVQAIEALLEPLAALGPEVLHIDNANPAMVNAERTRRFVRYLTPGSTAAMGVESFDPVVAECNNLNATTEMVFEAVRTIQRIGGSRGDNGCPRLLAGINLLLGLDGETPETLDRNFDALRAMLDEGLMIRRINIRQVVPFPGTVLARRIGIRLIRKHRRRYAAWIERVRREIDLPMLRRIFPAGVILRGLYAETHEGQVTFLRQLGSYPIIVGVRRRLPLGERFDVRITDHMLRSLTGELVE